MDKSEQKSTDQPSAPPTIGRTLVLASAVVFASTVLLGPSRAMAGLPDLGDVQRFASRTMFVLERNPGLGVAAIAAVYFVLRLLPRRGI